MKSITESYSICIVWKLKHKIVYYCCFQMKPVPLDRLLYFNRQIYNGGHLIKVLQSFWYSYLSVMRCCYLSLKSDLEEVAYQHCLTGCHLDILFLVRMLDRSFIILTYLGYILLCYSAFLCVFTRCHISTVVWYSIYHTGHPWPAVYSHPFSQDTCWLE